MHDITYWICFQNKFYLIVDCVYNIIYFVLGFIAGSIIYLFYYLTAALCIVGNKTDLQGRVKVPTEKGQRLANSHNAAFVESSAKQNIGKILKFSLLHDN